MTDCAHYFADPSGGIGWPSCVKCGAPASLEHTRTALRPCCRTTEAQGHTPTCQSVDARLERGQPAFPAS